MKTTLSLFVLVIICALNSFSQCIVNGLHIYEMGSNKYRLLKQINSDKAMSDIVMGISLWEHRDYLNGDSTFFSFVSCKFDDSNCLNENSNRLYFEFSDDKLYQIILKCYYNPSDLDNCDKDFEKLKQEFSKTYPLVHSYNSINDETNEQEGEGYTFYKRKEDSEFQDNCCVKIESVDIRTEMSYETSYDTGWHQTGKISDYLIVVKFLNLKNTRLDSRGY